jgi:F-type H+-transporting ATPase subunit epsilon
MNTIHFQLTTPERTVVNQEVDSVSLPTSLGQVTILPGHIPLVANVVPGEVVLRTGKGEVPLSVAGGVLQVAPGSKVTLLADSAERIAEIDEARAEEAVVKARQRLAEIKASDAEYASTAAYLERNLARLHVFRKNAHRRRAPITGEGVLEE